jgi:N-acetylmuramoyl-L-alanine amidase
MQATNQFDRDMLVKRTLIVNARAVHLAFASFLACCSFIYSAMVCSAAPAHELDRDKTISAARNCKEFFRIFIDVGHYRKVPGATSARGRMEFDFNLRLAQTLQRTLASRGYRRVKLFVSNGGSQSLEMRVKESATFRSDAFLSIHHDDVQSRYKSTWRYNGTTQMFSDNFRGYSLFISKLSAAWPASFRLATLISDEFLQRGMMFTRHHAEKIEGEGRKLLDDSRGIYQYDELIVLKDNVSPAVLIEAGVIVNREEELIVSSTARRELFSSAVSDALERFCVLKALGE